MCYFYIIPNHPCRDGCAVYHLYDLETFFSKHSLLGKRGKCLYLLKYDIYSTGFFKIPCVFLLHTNRIISSKHTVLSNIGTYKIRLNNDLCHEYDFYFTEQYTKESWVREGHCVSFFWDHFFLLFYCCMTA